jgi:hypothetical protein
MNPNFTWNLQTKYEVIEGMSIILRDADLSTRFMNRAGIQNIHGHFSNMTDLLMRATDPNIPEQQRNNAARTFNSQFEQVHTFIVANRVLERQPHDTTRFAPVNQTGAPFYHPDHGVMQQFWFDQIGIPLIYTQEQFDEFLQTERQTGNPMGLGWNNSRYDRLLADAIARNQASQ